jgi:hypothetical protein
MEWLWIIVAAGVALYLFWQWQSRKAAAPPQTAALDEAKRTAAKK